VRTTEFDFAGTEKTAKNKRRKRVVVVSAIAAVVLLPIAAYAAVLLFGFGTVSAQAATNAKLTVQDGAKLTKTLAPGGTAGLKAKVTNENDFKVEVTGLIVNAAPGSFTITPDQGQCQLDFAPGGTDTTLPAHGSYGDGPGKLYALSAGDVVSLNPGETKEITFPDFVKQSADATTFCGFTADYGVQGRTAS
jgi:hypothetical protein